jgi:hypothetical protein
VALIVAVIATFDTFDKINKCRIRLSLPKLGEIVLPAIIIHYGTVPIFHKVCIDQDFCDFIASAAVGMGQSTTAIMNCPHSQIDLRHLSNEIDSRHKLLRSVEAFRQPIKISVSVINHPEFDFVCLQRDARSRVR